MAEGYLDVLKHPVSTPIISGVHPLWAFHNSVFTKCVHSVGDAKLDFSTSAILICGLPSLDALKGRFPASHPVIEHRMSRPDFKIQQLTAK
jgi:hypothetical protein